MVLIDTSAWIEALRRDGDPATRAEVGQTLVDGSARLCELVVLELWNGARGAAEVAMLRRLEQDVELLAMTSAVWRDANALARRCRDAGVTVPATDLAIAACARHHGASLLHRDRDLDRIARAVPR